MRTHQRLINIIRAVQPSRFASTFTGRARRPSSAPWISAAATVAVCGASLLYWSNTIQTEKSQISRYGGPNELRQAIGRFRDILNTEDISLDADELYAHGFSELSHHQAGSPQVIVYPRNTDQVSQILKIANELRLPVIPYSGATSVEGHYSAPKGGICVDMQHFDKIISINQHDLDCEVEPGVPWEDLNRTLESHGVFCPVDPGPGAKIGGMVGTGCSGTNAVRYGTMRDWVLSLEVVLPDGRIVKTRSRVRKSSAGYNLTQLFIGSEGTLGIVTNITLKLAVIPKETSVAVCDFESIRDCGEVVQEVMSSGIQIGAMEILDEVMMKAVNLNSTEFKLPEKPTLYFKFSGMNKEAVQADIKKVGEIAKAHHGGSFIFAKTIDEQDEIWQGRKIAVWSSRLLKPDSSFWITDVCVPLSKLAHLIEETKKDVTASFLPGPILAHAGDGNIHVLILFHKDKPNEVVEAQRLNDQLIKKALALGGSCTGEHGIGWTKRKWLEPELGKNSVDLMFDIKKAMDPNGIMNPQKVLPDRD
ncbi:hypothetical protein SmJEL517_g06037 [Synchytrium microbalum]|uniref:D-lactate dehydrogenase (cytochrome) n=1 Tax=Synchytrium microbalum TaxID=1806994 RepID=A0A507BYG8_9FUNG|nr:uncharacterized protein SmJEL517_g06037 [Synchytrium microbalum]TPX30385.1 hypothetical protein SmJEL517_g06037 [Synchytrium microbalum]